MTAYPETHHPRPVVESTLPRLQTPARPEESDTYARVRVVLNPRWRVIVCKNSIQWILQFCRGQRHGRPRWEGRSFCRTREALVRCAREHAGEIAADAWAILLGIPERVPA